MSRDFAKGSGADNSDAEGTWKDGMWTVLWTRPLNLANPDDKALKEGGVYTLAHRPVEPRDSFLGQGRD